MKAPERFCEQADGGLARLLVSAGRDELPASGSLERTLVALGFSAAVPTLVTSAAAAKSATSAGLGGLFAKCVVLGALGGGAVVATSVATLPEPCRTVAEAVVSAPRAQPQKLALPRSEVAAPLPSSAPLSPPRTAPVVASAEAALLREVQLVARAREHVVAGDGRAALRLLTPYESEFKERRLLPEVLVLRMQAAELTGEDALAGQLARQLLSLEPKGVHAEEARRRLPGPRGRQEPQPGVVAFPDHDGAGAEMNP